MVACLPLDHPQLLCVGAADERPHRIMIERSAQISIHAAPPHQCAAGGASCPTALGWRRGGGGTEQPPESECIATRRTQAPQKCLPYAYPIHCSSNYIAHAAHLSSTVPQTRCWY